MSARPQGAATAVRPARQCAGRRWPARLLAMLLALPLPALAAQTAEMTAAYQAGTGDALVDAVLTDMNHYIERHPDAFVDELQRHAGVSRQAVQGWLDSGQWQGADVYFACQMAQLINQPCAVLLDARAQAAADGWKAVLATLEPGPGPQHWRQLRSRLATSYRHWARPLPPAAAALR